jgi:hypothetical protein
VESVERLLEKTTRDAFSDLMTLAADDRGMGIILTCRDYSVEQVRTSFLQPVRIKHVIIRVPPLDDAELMQVEAAHPSLAIPLNNPVLRNILRNPFFLDKALEIPWSAKKPVPESEHEFRTLFWREIVRADHRVPAGMGRRREEVLQEIAVRRARALSAHALCSDLDPAVIRRVDAAARLKVIAKIPKADAARFEAVLRGHEKEGERRDCAADELRELTYMDMDGMPAAPRLPGPHHIGWRRLPPCVRVGYPERTPSLAQLARPRSAFWDQGRTEARLVSRKAPSAARGCISCAITRARHSTSSTRVFNHSSDWYAHPRLHDSLEPPWEVELMFADGTTKKQWVNPRLWGLSTAA